VVRQPGRLPRLAAIVAVLGLLAGGAALLVLGADEPRRAGERADDPQVAFAEAVERLGYARSFAYRGAVHAAAPSALRPGPSISTDVTVEGAVRLPQSITRDVAVDDRGRAVETVTSGSTVWSRTAPSAEGLVQARWVLGPLRSLDGGHPGRLGGALVADALRSAGDQHHDGTDEAGRPVLRATVPRDDRDERYGDALDDADVRVTLDDAGDIVRVELTSAEPKPRLVLRLDIVRLGDAGVITPSEVGAPARSTVAVGDLVAAGVEPLELGRLPAGWALTDARVVTESPVMRATPERSSGCTALSLRYRDLRAVSEGWLGLTTSSQACGAVAGRVGTGSGGRPLLVGPFEGTVDEQWDRSFGDVSDGTTRVSFNSDLSSDELVALLTSLRRFDPRGEPSAASSTAT
jgi:hypothetical protein